MFGIVILVASLFAIESPRYLVRSGNPEKAMANLCKLRGMEATDPYVMEEMYGIERQHHEEQEATAGMGWKGMVREIFCIKRNSYRLFLTNAAQLLACWSGGSSITVYAHDLFQIVGITGQEASLLSTAIFGVVKFVAAVVCALFLVCYHIHTLCLAHHKLQLTLSVRWTRSVVSDPYSSASSSRQLRCYTSLSS